MPINVLFWAGLGVAVFGLLFIFLGLALRRNFLRQRERASMCTTATVVDLVTHSRRQRDGYRSSTVCPTYEFYINGEAFRVSSNIGALPSPFQVGEQIELYYNPENHNEIYIEREDRSKKLITVIFCASGGLVTLMGLALCVLQSYISL